MENGNKSFWYSYNLSNSLANPIINCITRKRRSMLFDFSSLVHFYLRCHLDPDSLEIIKWEDKKICELFIEVINDNLMTQSCSVLFGCYLRSLNLIDRSLSILSLNLKPFSYFTCGKQLGIYFRIITALSACLINSSLLLLFSSCCSFYCCLYFADAAACSLGNQFEKSYILFHFFFHKLNFNPFT